MFSEKPDAPGQPVITDITKDTASIHWTAPRHDGRAPITNYRIEMRSVGTYRWDMVNPTDRVTDLSHTIRGLRDETDYEFRVSAENRAGVSQPSMPSQSAKYGENKLFILTFIINS